jgi:hypothetical protein
MAPTPPQPKPETDPAQAYAFGQAGQSFDLIQHPAVAFAFEQFFALCLEWRAEVLRRRAQVAPQAHSAEQPTEDHAA